MPIEFTLVHSRACFSVNGPSGVGLSRLLWLCTPVLLPTENRKKKCLCPMLLASFLSLQLVVESVKPGKSKCQMHFLLKRMV